MSPTFRSYTRGARSAKLVAGSYHFARPGRSTAVTQARFYVQQLKAVGFNSGRDLPPVLDIEDTGGKGKTALTNWCLDFVHEVDRLLGLTSRYTRCGIYSNRDFYDNRMFGSRVLNGRWWWLARWPSGQRQPTDDDQMPAGSVIWQWTDRGTVPGVTEQTDLNVVRDSHLRALAPEFFGSGTEPQPVFRHYALRTPVALAPVDVRGKPTPLAIGFELEPADPVPTAHTTGSSSYVRRKVGWSTHQLSGVQLTGMKAGDAYQVQIVIVHPSKEELEWSAVVEEGIARVGSEFVSVTRSLRSTVGQRVRWRMIYLGKERDVKVSRADWLIQEY